MRPLELSNEVSLLLERAFPTESFLREEVDGIILGLINSVRWTAVRMAEAGGSQLDTIVTVSDFGSDVMSTEEIVNRIADTSGFEYTLSARALDAIVQIVNNQLKYSTSFQIEHLGLIRRHGERQYSIQLAKELTISPMSIGVGTAGD